MTRALVVKAFGFVENADKEVLLVNTAGRGWELPGGQLEESEGVLEALGREIFEESGCSVIVERLVGIYGEAGEQPALIHLFRCTHVSGDLRPSDPRVIGASWFSREQAHTVVQQHDVRERLEDALAQC